MSLGKKMPHGESSMPEQETDGMYKSDPSYINDRGNLELSRDEGINMKDMCDPFGMILASYIQSLADKKVMSGYTLDELINMHHNQGLLLSRSGSYITDALRHYTTLHREQDEAIKRYKSAENSRIASLKEFKMRILDLENDVHNLGIDKGRADTTILKLNEELSKTNDLLSAAVTSDQKHMAALEERSAELAKRDAELLEKAAVLERKEAELKEKDIELNVKIAELQAKDADLKAKIAELDKNNSELQEKTTELEKKDAKLAEFCKRQETASTSSESVAVDSYDQFRDSVAYANDMCSFLEQGFDKHKRCVMRHIDDPQILEVVGGLTFDKSTEEDQELLRRLLEEK